MLTQIFIKGDGCQPEFTKIVSHSFGFQGDFFIGDQDPNRLFFAGDYDPVNGTDYPVWSATKYDFGESYVAGSLGIRDYEKTAGIALPINLVPNDKITLSGTAYYPNYGDWIDSGFTSVTLMVGVYYFNCEASREELRLFTFVPVTLTDFDSSGSACFSTEITLGSSFDIHNTRLVIGYNTYATGDAVTPGVPTILTVSHTLDIERPCKAETTNYIIKNCCEPIITELVNIPGLVVGNFHVDDEGNCWEVIEESTDVTNFTRTFTSNYTTCLECQDDNGCPANLKIESCCVVGEERVSGSLPGLVVGDTFVDNHGLCWSVTGETSEPISEESITVVTIIEGACETCKTENPCPNFYYIISCCQMLAGFIAVPDILNANDSFVDAQGQCWTVAGTNVDTLPTIYGIEVVTVYPAGETDTCTDCIAANPCPTEYFITIRNCCDNDRVEVTQVPAQFMIFNEGVIFQDFLGVCWEVMSFSTTGVETYIIADWGSNPNLPPYATCKSCRSIKGTPCGLYEVKECGADTTITVIIDTPVTIGSFHWLSSSVVTSNCYEIIDYGYPVIGTIPPSLRNSGAAPTTTCEECLFYSNILKNVVWEYCDTPGVTYIALTPYSGQYSYYLQATTPNGTRTSCIKLLSVTTAPTDSTFDTGATFYNDCTQCLINN